MNSDEDIDYRYILLLWSIIFPSVNAIYVESNIDIFILLYLYFTGFVFIIFLSKF